LEGNRTVVIRNQSRHCIWRRALRSQSRHSSVGEHSSPSMAKHRAYILGLCDLRAAYSAHNRQPHRCLVDSGSNAFLVSGGCLHRHSRTGRHVFVLHTDDGDADEHRRLGRWRRQGSPLAMAAYEPRASRTHASRLACGAEGIFLVREAIWQRLTNCSGHQS
jgi:hypothetical protein